MKKSKFILIILGLFFCCLLFSQSQIRQKSHNHLKFMGIPINNDINIFAQKCVDKGFIITEKFNQSNKCIILSGQFTGKQCTLYIYGTIKSHLTWSVCVIYKPTSYQIQKEHYFELIDDLNEKYGKSIKSQDDYNNESFYGGEEVIYDILLKANRKKESLWILNNGKIKLWAFPNYTNVLTYIDKENNKIEINETNIIKSNDL